MTQPYQEFAQSLLASIAARFGLTYEQVSAEYRDINRTVIVERWRTYLRYEEQRLQRAMQPFVDRVYWSVAWSAMAPGIIGYDPQRLLPAPR